jgi:inositol 1,4,5-triphosphate receptor type 1
VFYDLSFFIIVIVLLLNLVFGIIIDAFGDMRDNRNAIEEDIKEKCFICGKKKFEFEVKNKSFHDHVH